MNLEIFGLVLIAFLTGWDFGTRHYTWAFAWFAILILYLFTL